MRMLRLVQLVSVILIAGGALLTNAASGDAAALGGECDRCLNECPADLDAFCQFHGCELATGDGCIFESCIGADFKVYPYRVNCTGGVT